MAINNYTYKKFLGLKFPFVVNKSSTFESLDDSYDVVKQNLMTLFKTERGSRIMRPNLGVSLRSKLGEPFNEILASRMADEIEDSINNYFPNVKVVDVSVEKPEELKFQVIIKYKLKNRVNQISPDEIKITIQ